MRCFSSLDNLETLEFSRRVINALHRIGLHTVGDLIAYPRTDFANITSLGKISHEEIANVLEKFTDGDYELVKSDHPTSITSQDVTFRGADGKLYIDIPVAKLNLSVRQYNGLLHAGVTYASQLLVLKDSDLLDIPNIGAKSIHGILAVRDGIVFTPFASDNDDSAETSFISGRKLSEEIIRTIQAKISLHAGELYESIYPVCEFIVSKYDGEDVSISDILADVSNVDRIFSTEYAHNCLKANFLLCLEKSTYGLDKAALFETQPEYCTKALVGHKILKELIIEGQVIEIFDTKYLINNPSVLDYANSINNEKERAVFIGRVTGKTLDAIGKELDLTRERVRQIESKLLRKLPVFKEDIYREVFSKYQFTKRGFLLGFKETEETYNYLEFSCKKGSTPVEELINDTALPISFRKAGERITYEHYVSLGNERVLRRRSELSEYVLRIFGGDGIDFDSFVQLYETLLQDIGLEDDATFSISQRGYENKLLASDHVLWSFGRKFRYYNINAFDFTEMLRTLDLKKYTNIEYSTLKFFRSYPELMNMYDIRDEYELHNLLKKICIGDEFSTLTFKRMPNIVFGCADRDNQVQGLLFLNAPITNTNFAELYESEYGVKANTILANYLKNFDKFFHNGTYKIDYLELPDEILVKMHSLLHEDFYTLKDFRLNCLAEFPDMDAKMLNPFVIKKLGFKIYSDYVIRGTFGSAVEYFRMLLTESDIVDTRKFPPDLLSTVAYTSELYKQRASYDILEFAPMQYVNIRRLNEAGLRKEDLYDFCKSVYTSVSSHEYFTVFSLRNKGFLHSIDEFGFDEWFYSFLLSEDKEHFSYRRVGGNKLLMKGRGEVTFANFIENIVFKADSLSIDIYDLMDLLRHDYNLNVSKPKITETIKASSMHYDSIMERIYADYDVYFEEV